MNDNICRACQDDPTWEECPGNNDSSIQCENCPQCAKWRGTPIAAQNMFETWSGY